MRVAGARARVERSGFPPTIAAAKAVIAVTSSCRPRSTPDWRVDAIESMKRAVERWSFHSLCMKTVRRYWREVSLYSEPVVVSRLSLVTWARGQG